MRLQLPDDELRRMASRTLLEQPEDPVVADLISLYLFLPVDLDRDGGRLRVRSSLEALIGDAHSVTGRAHDGTLIDEGRLGTWLGAMGYLSLIDQMGKALQWTGRPVDAATSFERILLQHGCSASEAAALYALRNAMIHSFGLVNRNGSRPDLQHAFRLVPLGGSPRVTLPDTPWDGDPLHAEGMQTTVKLQAIGDLGEVLLLNLQESWIHNRDLELAPGQTPRLMRRAYFFVHRP